MLGAADPVLKRPTAPARFAPVVSLALLTFVASQPFAQHAWPTPRPPVHRQVGIQQRFQVSSAVQLPFKSAPSAVPLRQKGTALVYTGQNLLFSTLQPAAPTLPPKTQPMAAPLWRKGQPRIYQAPDLVTSTLQPAVAAPFAPRDLKLPAPQRRPPIVYAAPNLLTSTLSPDLYFVLSWSAPSPLVRPTLSWLQTRPTYYVDTPAIGARALVSTPVLRPRTGIVLAVPSLLTSTLAPTAAPFRCDHWPNPATVKRPLATGFLSYYVFDDSPEQTPFKPAPGPNPALRRQQTGGWLQGRPFYYTDPTSLPAGAATLGVHARRVVAQSFEQQGLLTFTLAPAAATPFLPTLSQPVRAAVYSLRGETSRPLALLVLESQPFTQGVEAPARRVAGQPVFEAPNLLASTLASTDVPFLVHVWPLPLTGHAHLVGQAQPSQLVTSLFVPAVYPVGLSATDLPKPARVPPAQGWQVNRPFYYIDGDVTPDTIIRIRAWVSTILVREIRRQVDL